MGGEQAADVLNQVKKDALKQQGVELTADQEQAIKQPIIEDYEKQGNPIMPALVYGMTV